jgi:uncharacterized protein (TIGR00661 family)
VKILYGVVGEGMGHAIRSRVVIERLLAWGHEVEVVVSGRAYSYLKAQLPSVHEIWGLSIVMEDHEVKRWDTALSMVRGALGGWPENLKKYAQMVDRFSPEVVISDFETFSALYGHAQGLPVICLDNIQAVRRLWHPDEILRGRKADWRLTRSIIKAKIPSASHYLITSFFDAPPRLERVTVVPPILRSSILEARPTRGEHVLVYQTGESFEALPQVLSQFGEVPFRVYGLRRGLEEEVVEGNLTFCPFGEERFVEDLASCRGVIASAGFTLIGEALHLGKPYLATPVRGQFEQVMNARYLEHLGYGLAEEALDEFGVRTFLKQLGRFEEALGAYPRRSNEEMFAALEGQLDIAAARL